MKYRRIVIRYDSFEHPRRPLQVSASTITYGGSLGLWNVKIQLENL